MNEFTKFYTGKNYNQHMYSGLIGYFMRLCHRSMELDVNKKNRVLEIGPGTHAHIDYLKHEFEEYYILEKIDELEEVYKNKKMLNILSMMVINYLSKMNFLIELLSLIV